MICLILCLGSKHLFLYTFCYVFLPNYSFITPPNASFISCCPITLLREVLRAGKKWLCINYFLKSGFLNTLLCFHSHSDPKVRPLAKHSVTLHLKESFKSRERDLSQT